MPRGRNKVWFESSPGGIRGDLNPATIPKGEWLSSSNWLSRRGVGVPRPGYAQLGSTLGAADKVRALMFYNYPLQTSSQLQVHTQSKAYYWNGSSYTDITGTWTNSLQGIRLLGYQSGGTNYVLRINAENEMDKSSSGQNAFVDCTGAPKGWDACTVGPYVLVVTAGTNFYDAQWNAANNIDDWPAGNFWVQDATHQTVACRTLNNTSAAIWKYNALWVASLQAAKTAFQFNRIARVDGPTDMASVVDGPDGIYWLSQNYLLYKFDGSSVSLVSSAASKWAEANATTYTSYQVCAAYWPIDDQELWFFVPNTSSSLKVGLCFNLRTNALTTHTLQHEVYAALSGYPDASQHRRVLIIGGSDGKVYEMGDSLTDAGTAIPWHFEYGYVPTCNNVDESGEIDAVASYWKKTSSSCTVTVSLTPSDSISDDETAYTDTFDTSTATSNHSKTFRGKKGKWARLKFSGTSVVADLEYRGALLTSWQRSMT